MIIGIYFGVSVVAINIVTLFWMMAIEGGSHTSMPVIVVNAVITLVYAIYLIIQEVTE
jgi:hypothetical protein